MDDPRTAESEPVKEWLPTLRSPDTDAPAEQSNEPIEEGFEEPPPGGL